MVSEALQQAGLVIIGVHEPLINPHGSEYSYYLREYIRLLHAAAYKNEMRRYLFRRDANAFITPLSQTVVTVDLTRNAHPGWSRERTFYFHEGNGDDLLDYGVMRGYQTDFLKLCAGVKGSSRPADLVLSGHVHKNFECRLMWDEPSQRFRISHDFYTENPSAYYHSYDMDLVADKKFSTSRTKLASILKNATRRIHVSVADSASDVPLPVKNASGVWSVVTKPYALTLASQTDTARRAW